jgi:hypothetical protein
MLKYAKQRLILRLIIRDLPLIKFYICRVLETRMGVAVQAQTTTTEMVAHKLDGVLYMMQEKMDSDKFLKTVKMRRKTIAFMGDVMARRDHVDVNRK